MRRYLSKHLSPSMVIAVIALFVALGGASYAAVTLPSNSVGTRQLKANAVISSKVLNHSLLAADFKSGRIPKGPKGATGPKGPAGPAGPAGAAGAPGISGLGLVTANSSTGTGSHSVTATCPSGKKALSGGWNDANVGQASNESITHAAITDDGNGFRVDGKLSDTNDSWTLTAHVACATVAS